MHWLCSTAYQASTLQSSVQINSGSKSQLRNPRMRPDDAERHGAANAALTEIYPETWKWRRDRPRNVEGWVSHLASESELRDALEKRSIIAATWCPLRRMASKIEATSSTVAARPWKARSCDFLPAIPPASKIPMPNCGTAFSGPIPQQARVGKPGFANIGKKVSGRAG